MRSNIDRCYIKVFELMKKLGGPYVPPSFVAIHAFAKSRIFRFATEEYKNNFV